MIYNLNFSYNLDMHYLNVVNTQHSVLTKIASYKLHKTIRIILFKVAVNLHRGTYIHYVIDSVIFKTSYDNI